MRGRRRLKLICDAAPSRRQRAAAQRGRCQARAMQHLADLWSYDLSLVEVDKKDSILKEYEVSPVGSPMWRKWLPANFQKDRKCLLVALSRHANELRKEPGYWIGRHRRTPKSDSNDPKRPSASPKRESVDGPSGRAYPSAAMKGTKRLFDRLVDGHYAACQGMVN